MRMTASSRVKFSLHGALCPVVQTHCHHSTPAVKVLKSDFKRTAGVFGYNQNRQVTETMSQGLLLRHVIHTNTTKRYSINNPKPRIALIIRDAAVKGPPSRTSRRFSRSFPAFGCRLIAMYTDVDIDAGWRCVCHFRCRRAGCP